MSASLTSRRVASRSFGLALGLALLIALTMGATASAQCPFSGLTTTSYGTGTGVCSTSTLQATLSPDTCSLLFSFAPDEFHCGNTYLTQTVLILGIIPLPSGAGVGSQFLDGSRLYVLPLLIIGPLPGGSSEFTLPALPALIGFPFYAQAAPSFITTVSAPPIKPETGLSSALELVLH